MKKIASLAIVSMLLLGSVSTVSAKDYVVKDGDVLWKIARDHNTTIKSLVEHNNIKNKDLIYADQVIKLPEETTEMKTNEATKEKVAKNIEKNWELSGFSQPESVLAVADHEWLYVSNINGDDVGYISRLSKDGKIDNLKWVEGITTPTGMGLYDGMIYVADQTQVHLIDVASGKITKTIPSKAKTLNDISITKDGQVFISDLTTGSIYTIEDDEAVLWVASSEFPYPNGVLVQEDHLIVANIGSVLSQKLAPHQYGSLYKVNLFDKSVQQIKSTDKLGSFDGVVPFNDGLIVSNPFTKELYYVNEDEHILLADHIDGGIADIGSDDERQEIYAPLMFGNKVAAYKILNK